MIEVFPNEHTYLINFLPRKNFKNRFTNKKKIMGNLKEKFEVVWNTKHKDEIKMVFKVPVGEKRWYEFWKKNNAEKSSLN